MHDSAGLEVVGGIPRDDREAVIKRGRSDDQIRLRESMSALPAFLDEKAPFEHNVFGDREHSIFEHRPHFVRQPIVELGPLGGIGREFNAEANFGQCDGADVKLLERLAPHESKDSLLRSRAP